MNDIWFTILRWIILLAIVGVVVGTPVVYFNHRIDAAHELGVTEGRAACVAEYADASLKAQKAREAQALDEARKAEELQDKLNKAEKGSNDLRKKLADELQKNPPPSSCVLSRLATDSLRNLAAGTVPDLEGQPVPSPFDPKVSNQSTIPGQAPTRHGG